MEETKIFISYAHKDEAYFKIFKDGIKSHSKSSKKLKWEIWSDKEIPTGSLWHDVIQKEIKTCDAAILLVSANFLSSDYIENEEYLRFIKRNEEEGFVFLPILLSDCDFTQWGNLSNRQFFYPQGIDYGLPRIKNISYSHLVEFSRDIIPLPNPFRETFHKNCVEAFEKAIISHKDSYQKLILNKKNPNLISVLSNKDVINALNLFQTQVKEKAMNEKELADALDTKTKLINAIFGDFDNQLETKYKNDIASIVFDRIVFASTEIQKADIETISNFRNNRLYKRKDRSLLISGLTISLLNNFDYKKIHLLIDFLTDFEDGVWPKAIVGLIFVLKKYSNRLSLFPEIEKRLNELKEMSEIQNSIFVVDNILRKRTFSNKETIKNNPSFLFNRLKILIGNSIDFSRKDLIELQAVLKESSGAAIDNIILQTLFKSEIIKKFADRLEKVESINLSIQEFFEFVDFETYIDLYELNPLQFNLKDELYKSSSNWFLPFEDNEKVRNILASSFPIIDIEILDFTTVLQNSNLYDIDKHYILTHIKEFSDEFIYMLYFVCILEYSIPMNIPSLELVITKTIRDLYRFTKLSEVTQHNNIFNGELSIYGQSLLNKVANRITETKIKSQYLYDNIKYETSLEYLLSIPDNNYDFDVLELFIRNYIALKQDELAIPYLNKLLEISSSEKIDNQYVKKLYWHSEATRLYERLSNKEPDKYKNKYRYYLAEEISIREKAFNKSLENDKVIPNEDYGVLLANAYFDASINSWNYDKNIIECFFYKIKYLNVFFQIYGEHNGDNLLKIIKSRQESFIIVFRLILDNKAIDIFQILEKNQQNFENKLILSLKELFTVFQSFNSSEAFINTVKQNISIQEHSTDIYNLILPVVKNINENQPSKYENIVVPFKFEKERFDLTFSISDFLENGIEYITENLFHHSYRSITDTFYKEYISLFLDYLFTEKKFPITSKEKIIDRIIHFYLNNYIPTNETEPENSIDRIRNLIDQNKYETALSHLNDFIQENPNSDIAWNLKGNCLVFLNFYNEETLKCYNKSIELNENFQVALENRANVLIRMKQYEAALKDCEKALGIDPQSDFAQQLKKEALENIGT
jgi:hypothetical protein